MSVDWVKTEAAVLRFYVLERGDDPKTSQVSPEAFDDPSYRHIWEHITKISDWTATDFLSASQVRDVYQASDLATDLETHLGRMRKRSAMRAAVAQAELAILKCKDTLAVDELVRGLQEAGSMAQGGAGVEPETLSDVATRIAQEYLKGTAPKLERIPVPWHTLQRRNGGIPTRRMHIVAAVTSGRKTTMAKMMAVQAAKAGKQVLVWSLEDDNESVVERTLAQEMGGNPHKLRNIAQRDPCEILEGDLSKAFRAVSRINEWGRNVRLVDTAGVTVEYICSEVRRMKVTPDFLVVDFLQLIRPTDPRSPEHIHMQRCAQTLAAFAKEIGACVILVSQLTQEATKRGGEPFLGDIRGGAAIAQAAHTVLMGEPHVNEDGTPARGYTIHVKKCKDGERFPIPCVTIPDEDRIEDLSRG